MASFSRNVLATHVIYKPAQPAAHIMPNDVDGTSTQTTVLAEVGGQSQAMRLGLPFLAKAADGSLRRYRLDPERSTPALPVLIPV